MSEQLELHGVVTPTEPISAPTVKLSKWQRMTPAQREKRKAYIKAWRDARPGYATKTMAAWRSKNRAHANAVARRWRRKNRDKTEAAKKRWESKNPDKVFAQRKRMRLKHAASIRARNREYQRKNTDKCKGWQAKFKKNNLAQYRAQSHIHKNNRRNRTTGRLSRNLAVVLLVTQKFRCVYCQTNLQDVPYHRDHKIPVARGGPNEDHNMQLLCGPCNTSKFTMTHEEYVDAIIGNSPRARPECRAYFAKQFPEMAGWTIPIV